MSVPTEPRPGSGGFQTLVDLARERGGLAADDVIAALLPVFRQVADLHAQGLVAPLRGTGALTMDDRYRLRLDVTGADQGQQAPARLAALTPEASEAVDIVARGEEHTDVVSGGRRRPAAESGTAAGADGAITHPTLVPGWQTWEHLVGHHDPLTDVSSLGLLLCALSCGLDLALPDDVHRLAAHRRNLFVLNPHLHPVIASIASEMIEPDRRRRAQDVAWLAERLDTYRDQPQDFDLDEVSAGARAREDVARAVLTTLRDRLFDLSRRNRLLYFRSTQQSLDLTEASVPLLLDVRNIRADQILTWRPAVAKRLLAFRPLVLGTVLRWDDAPYASAVLDSLISSARRDRAEYGRAQLRLVIAFLRWHDLKGDRVERISSPLLLLPVSLTKKRGVRDSYALRAESNIAEVNPALRQQFAQLYGIELPELVDLASESVEQMHAALAAQIAASEPAVTLRLVDRPQIELVHRRALVRLDAFQRRHGRRQTTIAHRSYAHSYRRRDYAPLGLQIFSDRVVHHPAPLGLDLGETSTPRAPEIVESPVSRSPAVVEREADTYVVDRQADGNPYSWDFDLCALTLANFNYRTMSLVQDYTELLATGATNAPFDRVFSLEPRPLDAGRRAGMPLEDRYLVVPADASQVAAIARARDGESLVIQGPPGTGKSQTITNLIADFVAEGKRVLFVCQKRAAIDVVHARLREHGLDDLACLIHDSQTDKKSFVMALRDTYEDWLSGDPEVTKAERLRGEVVEAIRRETERLRG